MWIKLGWSVWVIAPVLLLAFHFGPGQRFLKKDIAADRMVIARKTEAEAHALQSVAYEAQFKTLEARKQLELNDDELHRQQLERASQEEQQAYASASDAWKNTADRYQEVETLLEGTPQANQIRWLRGRALVRAGEVFNGIEELQATLDQATREQETNAGQAEMALATAAREELAAAHYYGARLLREEGRSTEGWRQVSETSRQQFRFLAEKTSKDNVPELASNLQRNLERVLDLEQQDRSELIGRPIPKESPRGRRPGDGEPGKRPGIGPPRGDRPGNGASGMMEIGDGW
jgi:hypothetical protein